MSDISRRGPFINGHQLGRVCTDLAMANYIAPGNQPRSKEMHISSSLHRAGQCKGGSGRNGGGVSAPRGYDYTQGYC